MCKFCHARLIGVMVACHNLSSSTHGKGLFHCWWWLCKYPSVRWRFRQHLLVWGWVPCNFFVTNFVKLHFRLWLEVRVIWCSILLLIIRFYIPLQQFTLLYIRTWQKSAAAAKNCVAILNSTIWNAEWMLAWDVSNRFRSFIELRIYTAVDLFLFALRLNLW